MPANQAARINSTQLLSQMENGINFLSLLYLLFPQIVTTIKLLRKIGEFEFLLNARLLHTSSVAEYPQNEKEILQFLLLPFTTAALNILSTHISHISGNKSQKTNSMQFS